MKKLYTSEYFSEDESADAIMVYELTRDEWYEFSEFEQDEFEDFFGLYSDRGSAIPGDIFHVYDLYLCHHLVIKDHVALNV